MVLAVVVCPLFFAALIGSSEVLFLGSLAFVVHLFTARQGYFQLGETPFVEIELGGHHGESLFLGAVLYFFELLFVEQQNAVAQGLMVEPAGLFVGTDVHIAHHQLAVVEGAVGIGQVHFRLSYAFDFAASQYHPGFEPLEQFEFKSRFAVVDMYRVV